MSSLYHGSIHDEAFNKQCNVGFLCLVYFMSVFETTAYMATCDGMKFYLKVWSGLTSRQQDNLLDFIKDPTLISLRDQNALPKVAFSILEVSKIIIHTLCSI
jgi:hypothetical protein